MKINLDEKALQKLVQPAIDEMAKEYNRDFESLARQYRGKPVEQIKPALQRIFKKRGGKISDPELSDYAQQISDGVKIIFRS